MFDGRCSSLMNACQNGDITEVFKQLRFKPETSHQRDRRHRNLLHYCAGSSSIAAANKTDIVAAAGVMIAAPELLESADEDGFTPLHLAVIQGNLAMVNLLLANKADVHAVDKEGHSVVHWATVCGEVDALRAVLSAGAKVSIPDVNGGTPLHYAAQMCGASYEGKVNQSNSTKLALDILDILLQHPNCNVDVQDKDGRQPLLWASSAGSVQAVLALVNAGARVESADKDGLTALHCAASRGHTNCLDTLISLCGAPTDLIDCNGCTALHYAVTLGHADATSRLLDLEADPNRQDRKGRTPAHCGCSKGQFETVKLLKERGANLWLRNAKGDLPLHEAAASGRRELVEWILGLRPKHVTTTSNDGRSLLHIVAANDYTDLCKVLIDYGGDVNALYRNSKGIVTTPIDCALHRGNRSTAKFLQLNGGLPASKLKISGKPANPFLENNVDVVKSLKYFEKENMHSCSNCIIYINRSDSESCDEEICFCAKQSAKKSNKHVCKKHHERRLRRRTSSCGESKDIHHMRACSGMCRSKSNIEIRHKKSREYYGSSSDSEDKEDSCENCCFHKKQKQRVLRKKNSKPSKRFKILVNDRNSGTNENESKEIKNQKIQKEGGDGGSTITDPMSIQQNFDINATKESSEIQNNKEESIALNTCSQSPNEGTFIKSPVQSAQVSKNIQNATQVGTLACSGEEEAEGMTTEVGIHRDTDVVPVKELSNPNESSSKEDKLNALEILDIQNDLNSETYQEQEVHDESSILVQSLNNKEKKDSKDGAELKANASLISINDESLHMPHHAIDLEKEFCVSDNQEKMRPFLLSAQENEEESEVRKPSIQHDLKESTNVINQNGDEEKLISENDVAEKSSSTENKPLTEHTNISEPQVEASVVLPDMTQRENGARRSFTLLSSDPGEEEFKRDDRRLSFQVLKSDDEMVNSMVNSDDFKVLNGVHSSKKEAGVDISSADDAHENELNSDNICSLDGKSTERHSNRHDNGNASLARTEIPASGFLESNNGRKRRFKKRVRSGAKVRSNWTLSRDQYDSEETNQGKVATGQTSKDQDSGFEPSPRTMKSKIPLPRNIYTAFIPRRRPIYASLDGRSCSSRFENRKPGDKGACDMSSVTRSIQRNIRRYYMERKIFQHLLELKSLQIRTNKLNESVLVKRAVDDYHKSCSSLGGETGTRLRRYNFSEFSFKNFELFLYETLKALQKPGTYNFQNINEVYEEAERRLSPDYNAYTKALQCTTKTHRCLHATHAYTGIPCAAYIPMMNHHTMPKFGFGSYKKTGFGSFYLPKILTSSTTSGTKVSLELSHGKSKQLISLPSEKLDSNKRYYVTFTVKDSGSGNVTVNDGNIGIGGSCTENHTREQK